MDIAFHIGAHATDDGALLRSLLKNRDRLSQDGIVVPGPSRYRKLLREATASHRGDPLSPAGREVILEAVADTDDPKRLVFFNDSFTCVPARALEGGLLYVRIAKAAWLRALFPTDRCEFFLAMRNPATFVPALAEIIGDGATTDDLLDGAPPEGLRWSETIGRLRDAVPDAAVTVWCNEDTPIIWPRILRALAGLPDDAPVEGALDMADRIMSKRGRLRLQQHLEKNPPVGEQQWQRTLTTFLARYAVEDRVVEDLDLPGWTDEIVDRLTLLYEEDLDRVAAMDGVRFLSV